MTHSPYEDPHGLGTGDVQPIRIPPVTLCANDGCVKPTYASEVLCRDCYEAEVARKLRNGTTLSKPVKHL